MGLALAGVVWYGVDNGLRTPVVSNAVSNIRGYSLLEDGEFEQALEHFQAAVTRAPNEANPWDSLGEGHLANGMPDKSLEAYSRSLAIDSAYEASILGRGLALAALGRYDEALEKESPDFRVQAFLLSRVGRYREATMILDKKQIDAAKEGDAEAEASALLTSAWLAIEQKQYARALENVRAAERAATPLSQDQKHPLLVLADLFGGVAEIRAGNVRNAEMRLASQTSRYDADSAIELNWNMALTGEIALAQGRYDEAASSIQGSTEESVAAARTRRVDGVCDEPAVARWARAGGDGARKPVRPPSKNTSGSPLSGLRSVRPRCSNRGTCSRWRVSSTNKETTPARVSSTSGS